MAIRASARRPSRAGAAPTIFTKYLYDSDGNNTADAPLPACAQLQNGMATGTNPADPLTYFGAGDLGCVDTFNAGVMFFGKQRPPRSPAVRTLYNATRAP
jgi:hypothetical protein